MIFIFQLIRPSLVRVWQGVPKQSWSIPDFDGSTARQKILALVIVIAAIIWPFVVSRGSVDIATLTLIYVMLGLGLNVVVGLSGLLVLGYAGFYAIGAYTFALLNHYYGFGFWESLPIAGLTAALAGFLLGFLYCG